VLIRELAQRAGVTQRMVRHYANAGLLSVERDVNGYRTFDVDQVPRVRQIKLLLDLGLTVERLRPLTGCLDGSPETPTCPVARVALADHLARIDDRLADLTRLRNRIAERVGA
jgi:DNA-binding transcriptional MerR regulator